MSGIPLIALNEISYDEFIVTDSDGSLITGLTDLDFTRDLYDPNGNEVSGAITITITELGDGKYRTDFTPNLVGPWVMTIYHATYFPGGKIANYHCQVGGTLDPSEIADAVWDEPVAEHTAAGSVGEWIQKKLLTFKKFVGLYKD